MTYWLHSLFFLETLERFFKASDCRDFCWDFWKGGHPPILDTKVLFFRFHFGEATGNKAVKFGDVLHQGRVRGYTLPETNSQFAPLWGLTSNENPPIISPPACSPRPASSGFCFRFFDLPCDQTLLHVIWNETCWDTSGCHCFGKKRCQESFTPQSEFLERKNTVFSQKLFGTCHTLPCIPNNSWCKENWFNSRFCKSYAY